MDPSQRTPETLTDLSNQFLMAMPGMVSGDLAGTVIYLCEHNAKGALGLVINRPTDLSVAGLLEKIDLKPARAPGQKGEGGSWTPRNGPAMPPVASPPACP